MGSKIRVAERHDGLVITIPPGGWRSHPWGMWSVPATWLGVLWIVVEVDVLPQDGDSSLVAWGIVGLVGLGTLAIGGVTQLRGRVRNVEIEVSIQRGVSVRRGRRTQVLPAWRIGRIERLPDRIRVMAADGHVDLGPDLPEPVLHRIMEMLELVRDQAVSLPDVDSGADTVP